MDAYREYGSSGLSRDAASLYADGDAAGIALPEAAPDADAEMLIRVWEAVERIADEDNLPPFGRRCAACGYRVDAPGHIAECWGD